MFTIHLYKYIPHGHVINHFMSRSRMFVHTFSLCFQGSKDFMIIYFTSLVCIVYAILILRLPKLNAKQLCYTTSKPVPQYLTVVTMAAHMRMDTGSSPSDNYYEEFIFFL